MVLANKNLTASPSKTTPSDAAVITAPAQGAAASAKAGESANQAMLSRYIASRLKQFGTR